MMMLRLISCVALLALGIGCGGEVECTVGGEKKTYDSCEAVEDELDSRAITQIEAFELLSCFKDEC